MMLDSARGLLTPSARSDVPAFMVMDVMAAAARIEAAGGRVIHMEVGQPAFGAPSAAVATVRAALGSGPLGYTEALGIELRARIARHYQERYGVVVDPARIIVTTGSSAGFILAFLTLFEPGDRVAVVGPTGSGKSTLGLLLARLWEPPPGTLFIDGVDVRTLDDATAAELRAAIDAHRVAVIRGQTLTPDEQKAFSRRFGELVALPYVKPLDGHPEVIAVLKEADEVRVSTFGSWWHADFSYLEEPPVWSFLHAKELPPRGGDTLFADLCAAYEALSPGMRALLRGLTGVHSGQGVYAINAKSSRLGLQNTNSAADAAEAEHPVLCVQPATGREYLLVNSVIRRFKGMTEAESKPLIDYLFNAALKPEHMCRVRWQPGTLLLWANPMLMHSAIGDYSGFRRVTYRTTVEGWTQVRSTAETAAKPASQAA